MVDLDYGRAIQHILTPELTKATSPLVLDPRILDWQLCWTGQAGQAAMLCVMGRLDNSFYIGV